MYAGRLVNPPASERTAPPAAGLTVDRAANAAARWGWLLIVGAPLLALAPVLRNGFLVVTFDDDAFVLDNPFIRSVSWNNLRALSTQVYFHEYLPIPLLTYLADFQLWGLEPLGYHCTNLLFHIINSLLVYAVVKRACHDARVGMVAAMIFAVHPVQVETVSLIAQRKTLMATGLALLSLLAYQEHDRVPDGRSWYVTSVVAFAAACLSKASVVPFPALLVLYDYTFGRQRVRLWNKLPFVAIACGAALLGVLTKADVAVKPPQGGSYLATAMVMGRVMWEYVLALVLPVNLSPSYYYRPQEVFTVLNACAGLTLIAGAVALWRARGRLRLTFFFLTWTVISLAPVANIVPISVMRADRYLYLPMVAFAWWAGWGLVRVSERAAARPARAFLLLLPYVAVALLGVATWRYAPVYHDDVSAWTRVVARHPWNSRAHFLLGSAFLARQDWDAAERMARQAIAIDPNFDRPHRLLADLYRQRGDERAAAAEDDTARTLAAGQLGGS